MPFASQTSRPFTKANIESIDPNQIGVYGIFRYDAWIYVGRGDIRTRLLSHVAGGNPRITAENPTHWVAETSTDDMSRERTLIVEFNPIANRKIG